MMTTTMETNSASNRTSFLGEMQMEKTIRLIMTSGRPGTGLVGVIDIQPEELKEFAINTNYSGSVVFWDPPYCYRLLAIDGKAVTGNPQELHDKFIDEYGISLDFVEVRYQ